MIDRTLWVIGVICMIALGLFRWQFGKTRREMEDIVHEEFTKRVASLIDLDMAELKAQVKELQAQVKELQAHVPKELITAKVEGKDTVTAAQEVRPAVDSDLKQSIEQAENLVRLVDHEVHKLVKFRTRVMVERRAGKSLKPPINADQRP